jgi:anti-sigma regulatory factor (Ser/Thr protein kinase)
MLRAFPVSAEAPTMQPHTTDSGRDGNTVLDREFGAASLSGLRAAVLDSASAAGLNSDRAIDVMLAMHELAANVVRHGAGRGRLLMETTPQALRCEVSDLGMGRHDGRPAETAARQPRVGSRVSGSPAVASWPVEHGHGLWLVRRTADQVQVTTGPDGSVVCVIFSLPGRQ